MFTLQFPQNNRTDTFAFAKLSKQFKVNYKCCSGVGCVGLCWVQCEAQNVRTSYIIYVRAIPKYRRYMKVNCSFNVYMCQNVYVYSLRKTYARTGIYIGKGCARANIMNVYVMLIRRDWLSKLSFTHFIKQNKYIFLPEPPKLRRYQWINFVFPFFFFLNNRLNFRCTQSNYVTS